MAASGTICLGSSALPTKGTKQELGRRSVAFHPDVRGDFFINLSQDEKTLDEWSKRSNQLREEVLKMLNISQGQDKLDLIDTLYHLGISYHFEEVIEEALQKIYTTYSEDISEDNLYTLALRFRLLRQKGFNASSNAFNKFKQPNGSFNEKLASDVMGLLGLYEASFVGTRDDQILDEAIGFATKHLRAALPHIDSLLAERVAHSLELPLQKRLQRLEARYFISSYEQDSTHNEVLLEFAKLDYNILQSLHQREIRELARWWKDLNLVGKMSFVRNRLTECYFWMLGAYFEPQYSRGRIFSSKITILTSVLDDLYDVYGTIDELQLFTDAVYRWDFAATETLPDGIKPLYEAFFDTAKKFEEELTLEGNAYRIGYWKEAVEDICREYFLEAKWYCEGFIPRVEEYLRCGEISAGYPMAIPSCLLGAVEDATKEVFEWIKSYPKCIEASSRILRIADDIQSTKEAFVMLASSFQDTKSSIATHQRMAATDTVCLCSSAQPATGAKQELGRRSVAFHPDVWGDYFIKLSQDEKKLYEWSKRSNELREEVIQMLISTEGTEKLDLIDTLYHLGISYHFEEEIEKALQKIYTTYTDDASQDNLYTLALRFRLLRQNGFNASSNAFYKFKETTGSFKEKLASDVMGLLSLYEASFVGTREDQILDGTQAFTTERLRAALPHIDSLLAERVAHSLELPLHKRLQRLEARYFISLYEQDCAHNELLLEFAKLDYNSLQALHQREIRELASWWKDLNLVGKMSFVRNRLTECYFWMLGAYFEPQHSRGRIFSSKITILTSVVDDLYDVYGTIDELHLFTDAIYRWDSAALESLPDGIKPLYEAVLDSAKEFEKELTLEGNAYRVHYWKEAVQDICREYLLEAKWCCEGRIPQVEEYLRCGEISAGYPLAVPSCLLGAVEEATKEVFECVKSYPKCLKAASRILRIADDIQSTKFEQVRGHVVSVVQSYMNEHKCSEEVALEKLREVVKLAWKDINQACTRPSPFPRAVMKLIFNLTQVVEMLYQFGDGYTFAEGETKERIAALLVNQIPI